MRKADAVLPAFARAGQRGDTLKRVAQRGRCRLLFLLGVQHITHTHESHSAERSLSGSLCCACLFRTPFFTGRLFFYSIRKNNH